MPEKNKESTPLESSIELTGEYEQENTTFRMEAVLNDTPEYLKKHGLNPDNTSTIQEIHDRFAYILQIVPEPIVEEENSETAVDIIIPTEERDNDSLRVEALSQELLALFNPAWTHIRPDPHGNYILIAEDSSSGQGLSTPIASSKFYAYAFSFAAEMRVIIVETPDAIYYISANKDEQRINTFGKNVRVFCLEHPIALKAREVVNAYFVDCSYLSNSVNSRLYVNTPLTRIVPFASLPWYQRIMEIVFPWNVKNEMSILEFLNENTYLRRFSIRDVSTE